MDDLQRQIELAAQARIATLDAEIEARQKERNRLVAEAQCMCSHPEIVEMPYQTGIITSTPPARVCTTCGLAEYGWNCGHKLLSLGEREYCSHPRQVTFQEFYRYQRGPIHRNGDFVERSRTPLEILRAKLLGEES